VDYRPRWHEDRYYDEAKLCVDEFLTEDEVQQLRAYLLDVHDVQIEVEKVELPVPDNRPCLKAVPAGGLLDHYMMHAEQSYDLSIPIWAVYDLRRPGTVCIEESGERWDYSQETPQLVSPSPPGQRDGVS
jgi:hypothetical protein